MTDKHKQTSFSTSDSVFDNVISQLIARVPEDKQAEFKTISCLEEAQKKYYAEEAPTGSPEAYVLFAMWVKNISNISDAQTAYKVASGPLEKILAVRKLGTFYPTKL